MYIKQLSIIDLRSITSASIDFEVPTPLGAGNITLLLGGNGTGKTSILRAIALACLGPTLAESGFVPYRLVRNGAKPIKRTQASTATVTAHVILSEYECDQHFDYASKHLQLETNIERWGKDNERRERIGVTRSSAMFTDDALADDHGAYKGALFKADSSQFFVLAYGATRRVESSANIDSSARSKSRSPRYQRVAGLFEDGVTLMPLSSWLPNFQLKNPGRAKQVSTLLNKLLPDGCIFSPKVLETEAGLDFGYKLHGETVPFAALSDGYRAFIGWVADMLYHLTQGAGSGKRLDETQGIVLIDEIDLHLHPQWQRSVLPTLASALPKMQFIVTSHSPLVTASLHENQVRVLGNDRIGPLNESLEGRSVDQILRSPYFGLRSAHSQATETARDALTEQVSKGDIKASLAFMRSLAGEA